MRRRLVLPYRRAVAPARIAGANLGVARDRSAREARQPAVPGSRGRDQHGGRLASSGGAAKPAGLRTMRLIRYAALRGHLGGRVRTVFRDRPVRPAISRSGTFSRKYIRLILASMPTVITPVSPAQRLSRAFNHVGQNSMKTTGPIRSIPGARQHSHPLTPRSRQPAPAPDPATPAQTRTLASPSRTGSGRPAAR